jgi:sugar phosphate isomerase/epimerase
MAAMRFAICNELFEGWEFERVCRYVKSVGYDGLEVAPFTLAPRITDVSAADRARLRGAAAAAGIDIVGLHWLLAKTEGFYLTSPDRSVRERTSAYLVALAEACRDLGGELMVFGSPKQRSLLPGISRQAALDLAAETFQPVLPTLSSAGVTLCLEPLSPAETDFLNTCDEALALVRRLNHPNVVLHMDVKAMASEPTPVTELIGRHAGAAGHFHANDPNLRGPGFGDTDFVPIFKALDAAGYDKWVSVEVFDFSPDPETVARQSVEYMERCRPKELSA